MRFKPGDDVIVTFDGAEHVGQFVVQRGSGFIEVLIDTDPLWDYGRVGEHMSPRSPVCVREKFVRPVA